MNIRSSRYDFLGLLIIQLFLSVQVRGQHPYGPLIKVEGEEEVRIRNSIRKGEHGFVWMATNNGLCRFDGQRFKFYQNDPRDSSSIFSNDVQVVLPVGDEIWVGTNQGLSVLNIHTHQFRNYQLDENGKVENIENDSHKVIISLFQDRQGEIWIGARYYGFWKYDPGMDDFINYGLAHYPALTPAIYSPLMAVSIDQSVTNDSIIWMGTGAGLIEVNKYSHSVHFYIFPQEDKNYQTGVNFFRQLYHHSDGLLYVGSWADGVHVFDPERKTLTPLAISRDQDKVLLEYPVAGILPKSDHELWFTTSRGLFLYNTLEKRIVDQQENDLKKQEFFGVRMVDEANRIWYSNFQGLFLNDPNLHQFRTFSFAPIITDDRTNFAFLTQPDPAGDRIIVCPRFTNGLFFFDFQKETWTFSKLAIAGQNTGEESTLRINGFGLLQGNDYVFSGDQGVFRYSPNEKRLRPVLKDLKLKNVGWTQLLVDSEDQLWIGSWASGLFRVDPGTGRHEVFTSELLLSDSVTSTTEIMFEDSRRNIWLKRTDGFSVYVRARQQFKNFLYTIEPSNSFPVVNAFAENKFGQIWTCSEEGWIGYMEATHPERGVVQKINVHDLGVEGQIYNLQSDPEGNIWGCTNREIFRIDERGNIVSSFSLKYSNTPIDFFSMNFLPDGQLVIGGRRELTFTHPNELKRNAEAPRPYITQVNVKQKPLAGGYPLFGGQPIKLRYNENFFSIAYAAQGYTFGKEVKFRYRLQDLEDWVEADKGLVANYTHIPPGEYTFQLMAANNEGQWNEKVLEIPVIISQAWYKRGWFLTLLGILAASGIYAFFTYRINQVRKEEKLKTAFERKLASKEMSALVAQMNPHFLFNSLNSIDSYIIRNESMKASEYLNNFARLMRLILQNSRSSHISLKDEIEGLELYLQMESMRFTRQFSYDIHIEPEVDIHQIEIPPMLIQPYLENAIWHGLMHLDGEREGKVELSIALHGQKLQIAIWDNGIGRQRSAELRIKKSESHKQSMGMQITESRIQMINKLYDADASVIITDLYDECGQAGGTQVVLSIAI